MVSQKIKPPSADTEAVLHLELTKMKKTILAQNIVDANNDQWWIDHDAYADALKEFRTIEVELQDALGVVRKCKPGEGAFVGDILDDLDRNRAEFGLLNRFKLAHKKMIEAKGKL